MGQLNPYVRLSVGRLAGWPVRPLNPFPVNPLRPFSRCGGKEPSTNCLAAPETSNGNLKLAIRKSKPIRYGNPNL